MLAMDIAGSEVSHQAGFLCDKVEIVHRDGSPKHGFLFERGLTKVAARLTDAIRGMAGQPAGQG